MPVFDRLLTDPEHRRELGENGRRMVEEQFIPETIGAQLRRVLEEANRPSAWQNPE